MKLIKMAGPIVKYDVVVCEGLSVEQGDKLALYLNLVDELWQGDYSCVTDDYVLKHRPLPDQFSENS